jgi:hypothetical protein
MYSKPVSRGVFISSGFSVTFTVNSSLKDLNIVRSMFMYISVLSSDLWSRKSESGWK